ncbi:trypsin-like peptidase domain-containing protein [Candidatus Zixiibacteriota bacterium]
MILVIALFLILTILYCSRTPVPGPRPSQFPVIQEPAPGEDYVDLNTILMESTFKLQGTTSGDSLLFGTAFVFDIPCQGDPGKAVLVTSSHLLDSLYTERALLGLRDKNWDGSWEERPWWIQIRHQGEPLWIRHHDPDVDVAAMCVELPRFTDIPLNSVEFLADAETFEKYEIHPGDELMCLGYSSVNGVHGSGGFPILRGGVIASYPLAPVEKFKTFRYDVEIFRGYSGGPVYFSQLGRLYGGASHPEEQIQFIVGLLSKQWFADQEEESPLKVAEVVHAHFIREIVEELLDTGSR